MKVCQKQSCGDCKIVLRASPNSGDGSVGDIVNEGWMTTIPSKERKKNVPEAEEHSPDASSTLAPIEKAKAECEELGFTPKTEAYGDCVLRLLEMN